MFRNWNRWVDECLMKQNGPQLSEGLIILLEFILTLSGAVLHSYGPRLMDLEEAAGFSGKDWSVFHYVNIPLSHI